LQYTVGYLFYIFYLILQKYKIVSNHLIYNYKIWNVLALGFYFPDFCIGVCAPLYLRLPKGGTLAPEHVAVLKTYVQFVILLCASGGECD
jgi:hypothetical protein